ncbi:MAG: NAD+ synthase [Candidatus Pacebacteria bacterium]|nr:NAD+ synthase [Candidatus Paceibacterota bacterium]
MRNAAQEITQITQFLTHTYAKHGIAHAVVAVSGGIDSAVSLSLLARAVPREHIFPVLLPYGRQNMDDAKTMCVWNSLPKSQWVERNIQSPVNALCSVLNISSNDHLRKGNVMARVRMIAVYDTAKEKRALVCGTENKSEHYLGYFTRFGDAASDIEPIAHLYKTEVYALAQELGIPQQILSKAPSAGLWNNQTDENELGFTYEQADQVLEQLIDKKKSPSSLVIEGIDQEIIQRIVHHVHQQAFKLEVPYSR